MHPGQDASQRNNVTDARQDIGTIFCESRAFDTKRLGKATLRQPQLSWLSSLGWDRADLS